MGDEICIQIILRFKRKGIKEEWKILTKKIYNNKNIKINLKTIGKMFPFWCYFFFSFKNIFLSSPFYNKNLCQIYQNIFRSFFLHSISKYFLFFCIYIKESCLKSVNRSALRIISKFYSSQILMNFK